MLFCIYIEELPPRDSCKKSFLMDHKFGNKSGFDLKTKIKHNGKFFDEVCVGEKIYWIPSGWKLRYIGATAVLNKMSGSTYSDHHLMCSVSRICGLRIGTFNACLTNLALRGLQCVCNSSGDYTGMITGDRFQIDTERRNHVINYIVDTLYTCDILLLQEIDEDVRSKLCKRGVSIVFTEDYPNSVRGGNAICTFRSDIVFTDCEPIWDKWTDGQKLVGTYCVATLGQTSLSVASYHFDKHTPNDIIVQFMRHNLCIFGGDFNKDVDQFSSFSIPERLVTRMTDNDEFRYRTIDAIFFCRLQLLPPKVVTVVESLGEVKPSDNITDV